MAVLCAGCAACFGASTSVLCMACAVYAAAARGCGSGAEVERRGRPCRRQLGRPAGYWRNIGRAPDHEEV